MLLLPEPVDAIRKGVESVVEAARVHGAPEPPWIAVEDGSDRWIAMVAARSPGERARGVLAMSSDRGLVVAHRLGLGGAFRLPASLTGARDALVAASSAAAPPALIDPAVLGLIDGADVPRVVSVADNIFWRCHLGEHALASLLAQLASRLEVPPAILPWPALVIGEAGVGRVPGCWHTLESELGRSLPDLVVTPVEAGGGSLAAGVFAALLSDDGRSAPASRPPQNPVHELPAGDLVGWWGLDATRPPSSGWLATPVTVGPSSCRWKAVGEGVDGIITDVATAEEVSEVAEAIAVRLPGWLVDNLRPGTPAGLLVSDLAVAADRRGLPLWIPNVNAEALQTVLRLPGVVWVDGSAVPRSG